MVDIALFKEELSKTASDKSCLVSLTGGIESSSLLYMLSTCGAKVSAFFTDCGCPGELRSAEALCSKLGVSLHSYDLRGLLIGQDSRDAFSFIAMAYGLYVAQHLEAEQLYLGFEREQLDVDNGMVKFVDEIGSMYASFDVTAKKIAVVSPYQNLTKPQVIRLASSANFDLSTTWSCDRHGATHCGECGSCLNRKRAFAQAGVTDPTVYLL